MASLIQFYNPVIDQWLSGAGLIPCKIVKRSSSENIWETILCQQNYFIPAQPPLNPMLLLDPNTRWRRNVQMNSTNICHRSKMKNISKWIYASDFRMEMNQKKISPDCRWLLCWWSLNNKIWWDRYRVSYDYNVGHIWIQWGHLTEHQDVRGNLINSGSTLIGKKYLHLQETKLQLLCNFKLIYLQIRPIPLNILGSWAMLVAGGDVTICVSL